MNMNQQTVQAKPATLREVLSAINGRTRGAYVLGAKKNEYNELVVTLFEVVAGRRYQRAQGFIDLGHTTESKQDAYAEALCTASIYLREPLTDEDARNGLMRSLLQRRVSEAA